MSRQGKEYLAELVESVICIPNAFNIKCENCNLISVFSKDKKTTEYFAVSAIYDTICLIDVSIRGCSKIAPHKDKGL